MTEFEQREPNDNEPFVVWDRGTTAVVRFAEHVDHQRGNWDGTLAELISSKRKVVWDLTNTVLLESEWLRLLARLHEDGKDRGTQVVTIGMGEVLRGSADYLGLEKCFEHTDSPAPDQTP